MVSNSGTYPNNVLRAKLAALGIPPEEHDFKGLKARLPFSMDDALNDSIEVDTLADVLIYLIEKNVVLPSAIRDGAMEETFVPGAHYCHFYHSKQELLDLAVPFFKEGLKGNDCCVWLVHAPLSVGEATQALELKVNDIQKHVASGQMTIVPWDAFYIGPSGKFNGVEQMIQAFEQKEKEVVNKGFRALRAAGICSWRKQGDAWREFLDFEQKVNSIFATTKLIGLCSYPLHADLKSETVPVIGAHQKTLLPNYRGSWQYVNNKLRDQAVALVNGLREAGSALTGI